MRQIACPGCGQVGIDEVPEGYATLSQIGWEQVDGDWTCAVCVAAARVATEKRTWSCYDCGASGTGTADDLFALGWIMTMVLPFGSRPWEYPRNGYRCPDCDRKKYPPITCGDCGREERPLILDPQSFDWVLYRDRDAEGKPRERWRCPPCADKEKQQR